MPRYEDLAFVARRLILLKLRRLLQLLARFLPSYGAVCALLADATHGLFRVVLDFQCLRGLAPAAGNKKKKVSDQIERQSTDEAKNALPGRAT